MLFVGALPVECESSPVVAPNRPRLTDKRGRIVGLGTWLLSRTPEWAEIEAKMRQTFAAGEPEKVSEAVYETVSAFLPRSLPRSGDLNALVELDGDGQVTERLARVFLEAWNRTPSKPLKAALDGVLAEAHRLVDEGERRGRFF